MEHSFLFQVVRPRHARFIVENIVAPFPGTCIAYIHIRRVCFIIHSFNNAGHKKVVTCIAPIFYDHSRLHGSVRGECRTCNCRLSVGPERHAEWPDTSPPQSLEFSGTSDRIGLVSTYRHISMVLDIASYHVRSTLSAGCAQILPVIPRIDNIRAETRWKILIGIFGHQSIHSNTYE